MRVLNLQYGYCSHFSVGAFLLQLSTKNYKGGIQCKTTFTNPDQLPLFLNANTVAQVLGVSISSAYELMHETGFPALRIGSRIVVPKRKVQSVGRCADRR